MKSRSASFLIITAIYLFSGVAGALLYRHLPYAYWMNLLLADVTATVIVFVFSVLYGNASVYDPYWSVFPVAAILVIAAGRQLTTLNLLHIAAICFWGIRLTGNWAFTFHGLQEQDWRYTMLRERTGRLYPAVNLFGIHLVPTLIVYLCFLPAVYAIEHHLDGGALSWAFEKLALWALEALGRRLTRLPGAEGRRGNERMKMAGVMSLNPRLKLLQKALKLTTRRGR